MYGDSQYFEEFLPLVSSWWSSGVAFLGVYAIVLLFSILVLLSLIRHTNPRNVLLLSGVYSAFTLLVVLLLMSTLQYLVLSAIFILLLSYYLYRTRNPYRHRIKSLSHTQRSLLNILSDIFSLSTMLMAFVYIIPSISVNYLNFTPPNYQSFISLALIYPALLLQLNLSFRFNMRVNSNSDRVLQGVFVCVVLVISSLYGLWMLVPVYYVMTYLPCYIFARTHRIYSNLVVTIIFTVLIEFIIIANSRYYQGEGVFGWVALFCYLYVLLMFSVRVVFFILRVPVYRANTTNSIALKIHRMTFYAITVVMVMCLGIVIHFYYSNIAPMEISAMLASPLRSTVDMFVVGFCVVQLLVLLACFTLTSELRSLSRSIVSGSKFKDKSVLENKHLSIEYRIIANRYNSLMDSFDRSSQVLERYNKDSQWRGHAQRMVHDIKNPLTPIKLTAQLLQYMEREKPEDFAKRASELMGTMLAQIDALTNLLDEFQNLASINSWKPTMVDVCEVVQGVVSVYQNYQGVKIQWQSSTVEQLLIYADGRQLGRVFGNLCKNAIEAVMNLEGGFVSLSLRERDNTWVEVSVKDNGEGISEQMRARIFEPNFSTKRSGSGLGLAIAREIVEGCGGKIECQPGEPSGTIFRVLLPKNAKPL